MLPIRLVESDWDISWDKWKQVVLLRFVPVIPIFMDLSSLKKISMSVKTLFVFFNDLNSSLGMPGMQYIFLYLKKSLF